MGKKPAGGRVFQVKLGPGFLSDIQFKGAGVVMRHGNDKKKFNNVFAMLGGNNPKYRMTTATVSNTAPQAVVLHQRDGFFVMDNMRLHQFVKQQVSATMKGGWSGLAYVESAVARGIVLYINWLRAQVGTKPPTAAMVRAGMKSPRPMHVGKWADITGRLNNSWRFKINNGPWVVESEWQKGVRAAARNFKKMYPKLAASRKRSKRP